MPYSDAELVKIVASQEEELRWGRFTEEDAWTLGNEIRSLFVSRKEAQVEGYSGTSIVISISLFNGHILFQTAVGPGATPDNWNWVKGKTATVKRYGHSSFYIGRQAAAKGPEGTAKLLKYAPEMEYVAHGGAVPIFIEGLGSQPIGAVVVSGLVQAYDHQLVVDAMRSVLKSVEKSSVIG